ncbi:MAG: GIY-YIG nuclease family protein [Deltaproteobacteria bacterium]|nr:GIY-YIG nuclease family protein [Deltaproteobacteria bacterium]
MAWHVYILECADGSLYTGVTIDLERRVGEHNRGVGAKYTIGRRPVQLVYSERVGSRSEAGRREYAIKRLSRSQKLSLIRASSGALGAS